MASVAGTEGTGGPEVRVVRRSSPWAIAAKWLGIILAVLIAAIIGVALWINSDSGRRFIVGQINGLEMASGLRVHVDRIDGSIWDQLTLHGLTLSDPQGAFFAAPVAELDYRPLEYLRGSVIDIRVLRVPEARLARLPALISTDPNAPMIPNINLDIARLEVGRLILDPPVTGQRHLLGIAGDLHLADSAARANLDINALAGPGIAGGDRASLRFEAAPEQNRLNIAMRVQAPGNGFVASMTGLTQPLDVSIGGEGSWASWDGRLRAIAADQAFANLQLRAENGTFTVSGPLRADVFVTGPAQRLTEPVMLVNGTMRWADQRADVDLRIGSQSVVLATQGRVNLAESRYEGLLVAGRLLRPGAIAPNLAGRDVRLALAIDGAFGTPTIAYDLRAAELGISTRSLQNVRLGGAARVDTDRIVVPVAGTIQRIAGLPDAVGGLLTNVRVNGDILVEGTNILSDNLRLRSDRADAVLALAFDVGRGRYNVGIQGRVDDYLIQSVGIVDLTSDFDVVATADGSYGIRGRVAVRTKRIFNATAADLLGGNAVISANIAMGGDGAIRVGDVRLSAPQLRITEGGGVYYPDGRLALRLAGTSNRYGAIGVQVAGSINAPQVRLTVARPGFGVGLANVVATVRTTGQGYAIEATGDSSYGPFSADLLISARAGPLTVQVNRLLFAGLTFAGRISQTQAGPFEGALTMTGQGVNGDIRLAAAAGARQQVSIDATANGATIPGALAGETAITIQRALVDADIILPNADDPPFAIYAATGDMQVAGLTSGRFLLERARANINYANNQGQLRFLAAGTSGVPFEVAGNAALTPQAVRAALQGQANRIPFRTVQPAVIERVEEDWVLRPTTVTFREGQGSLRLAGRYGDGIIVQSRLDSLDLSIANTMSPSLGVGGAATGSLDFYMPADGGLPRAEARLSIQNFTRTGIVTRSVPVNLALAGNLRPEGGALAAVIRQNDAVIGRFQARLQPLGPGEGSWTTRLYEAPLSGGIRYTGPASVLTSLANFAGHHLEGAIGIGADFSGQVSNPQFSGVVRANNLTYTNDTYGTRLTNLAVDGRFSGSNLELVSLTGRAGEGTIRASGTVGLSSDAGYPIRLDARLDNARLARSDDISATATGDIQVRNGAGEEAVIRGTLNLGEIRYQITRQGSAQVPQLAGVRRRGDPVIPPGQQQAGAGGGIPSSWRLDLTLVADNRVFVSGMGLESEWAANIRVRGTTATPEITGNIDLVRGTLSFAGRRFELDGQSNIALVTAGQGAINPQLNVIATSDIDDVTVEVRIGGSATNPQIAFGSTPNLPQDEIISRILFGSSVTEISAIQAVQLAASLNALRGGSGGLNPLGALQGATGIDRLRILGEDDTTGRGTAVAAGFYLSDDIYVEIITDARGFTATQIELSLTRSLSILSQFGTSSETNATLRYSRDY